MVDSVSTLGNFLDFSLWQQALKLLNFQIACQGGNRHFKTLSMIYYQRLGSTVRELESEDYFEKKVASNLFYGLGDEFAVYPYVIPKAGLGLRRYNFFTYPLRAVHYAVGLYLVKLSEEFLGNFYSSRQQLRSFYGGKLYFQDDELQLTKTNVYFKKYYTNFRNRVRSEAHGDVSNKIIIRLDIENYFEQLSTPVLLDHLDRAVKPSGKARMHFNATTREQIAFFFRFLANGGDGIPQSDNSLIASFMGHLYLVFGDLYIEEQLCQDMDIVDEYSITRYVDDIYVSITFKESVGERDQNEYAESLGARVADRLYCKLGLRLNPKTRFFCLGDQDQLDELLAGLKKVSPEYHLSDEQDDEPPARKIDNIFDELNKLKVASIEPETFKHALIDEILKEVFDKRVGQMLDMDTNKERIRQTFRGVDFNRVKEYPLPITIVLMKEPKTARKFRKFLLNKRSLTTRDVYLILTYLCQVDFADSDLISKLEDYAPMRGIMGTFSKATLSSDWPGYYDLQNTQVVKVERMPYVIDQVRHRVLSERTRSYSVALNHLLNEIHAVCYELEKPTNHRDYGATEVVAFLNSQRVPPDVAISIRNLFDRRNTNQVSHPGSEDNITWSVDEEEYSRYRSGVGECLRLLL